MFRKAHILIAGRTQGALTGLSGLLDGYGGIAIDTKVHGNGHGELWRSNEPLPDALVLGIGENWHVELPPLLAALPANKPPFLVACPVNDIDLMKLAMRAGARDVVTPPYEATALAERLLELARESHQGQPTKAARMIAFINAKGGSGGSFMAVNVALDRARSLAHRVMLVDLDIQFASLSSYLNMNAGNGLIRALESADSLDTAAITGYAQKHESSLQLLTAAMSSLIAPDDIAEQRVAALFEVLGQAYDDIVVDLPRRIDRIAATVLERLDKVVLVTQQTVTHLQDTKRIFTVLRDYLGISNDRITIVINRFDRKAEVRRADFAEAFPGVDLLVVPSDFRRVAESINLGTPVIESAPGSAIGKSLKALSERVLPDLAQGEKAAGGLLSWLGVR